MKHLSELSGKDIHTVMNSFWFYSEKLDGSYMRAGLDEKGVFYTARKGKQKFYRVEEWPDMPWTNYFRSAHLALENLFEVFILDNRVEANDYIEVELLPGRMPNSIEYPARMMNSMFITDSNFSYDDAQIEKAKLFKYLNNECTLNPMRVRSTHWFTLTGEKLVQAKQNVNWNIFANKWNKVSPRFDPPYELGEYRKWLAKMVKFRDTKLPVFEALDLKLNAKPACVSDEDWKANRKEILEEIRALREPLKRESIRHCNAMARCMKHLINTWSEIKLEERNPDSIEGVVVSVIGPDHDILVKLVDTEHFAPLNNFTHIVRYWLQGGRRPERPCFLSRTAHWPVEKRLARLEVLRKRYIAARFRLMHVGSDPLTPLRYTQADLDQRTLLLFAELKERIKDGRCGFQGQSTENPQGGDS